MIRYRHVLSAVALCILCTIALQPAHAAQENTSVFSMAGVWAKLAASPAIEKAWRIGARKVLSTGRVGVFYDGQLYGFAEQKIPSDKDGAQARLTQGYIQRMGHTAVNTLGLFAFNDFDCSALADFEQIVPDIAQCNTIPLSAKVSSDWEMTAFSIVQAPADALCACKIALDKGNEKDNANSFYGAVARAEISRLHDEQKAIEVVAFFNKNYSRKIFYAPELLMAASCFLQTGDRQNALTILDAIRTRYAETISSEELEHCGDMYYSLGREDEAAEMYNQAASALSRHAE